MDIDKRIEENKENINSIISICSDLSQEIGIKINVNIKKDLSSILHDRKIRNNYCTVVLGHGLNLFEGKSNRNFRANNISLSLDDSTQLVLNDCIALPNYNHL